MEETGKVEIVLAAPLEPGKLKNGLDASIAGKAGAAKREENRLARLSSAREHIEQVQLPAALQAFDDLLQDTDPRARRYRFAAADKTLDRMLPTTKHIEVDIRAEVSALVAAFKEST